MLEYLNKKLFRTGAWARTGFLWVVFMSVTWSVAIIAYLTHPQAWQNVPLSEPEKGWGVLLFILGSNLFLLSLIVVGNLFVRFGPVTVGLIILLWQAITIGWTAGTNGFTEPFPSFAVANRAFLFVGLWETTAYVLICATTLTKSLLISDTFPAREWADQRKLKDLSFNLSEKAIIFSGFLLLIGAAIVEAFIIY